MRIDVTESAFVLLQGEKRSVIRRGGSEQTVDRVRIALCRCGDSTSKPYCDMTHLKVGFVAARSEIEPQPIYEAGEREGHVKITSMENGPNKVEGAGAWRVVRDGVEETIARPAIFLCRCGHSENKPFCDGTHRKIGFEAPAAELEVTPEA